MIRGLPAATGSQEVGNRSAAVTVEINAPGCSFRFPLSEPIPMTLTGGIANLRVKEVAREGKAAARWAPARLAEPIRAVASGLSNSDSQARRPERAEG